MSFLYHYLKKIIINIKVFRFGDNSLAFKYYIKILQKI